jgi:cell division protein FtsB
MDATDTTIERHRNAHDAFSMALRKKTDEVAKEAAMQPGAKEIEPIRKWQFNAFLILSGAAGSLSLRHAMAYTDALAVQIKALTEQVAALHAELEVQKAKNISTERQLGRHSNHLARIEDARQAQ